MYAKCYRREVRGVFPGGSTWIDTHGGIQWGGATEVRAAIRSGSKEGATAFRVKLESVRRGTKPELSEQEQALIAEEGLLRRESTLTSDGQERLQRILGPEWQLIGKATSHERGNFGSSVAALRRDKQHRPGQEGCTFSFRHRLNKIPPRFKFAGRAACITVWFRPRIAFIERSLWLMAEQGPFPVTIGACGRDWSLGVCDHEVVFADIRAPNAEGLARRLREGLGVSLENMPRTALTTMALKSASDPTLFVLDGRPGGRDDSKSASFFVRKALMPLTATTSRTVWEGFTPRLAEALDEHPGTSVLIMTGIEALADECVDTIREYVARGNGLLVLGDAEAWDWLNGKMAEPGLLPGKIAGFREGKRARLAINTLNPCHAALAKLSMATLGTATAHWDIRPRADAWPVADVPPGFSRGWAFDSTYGRGRTMVVGLRLDGSCSNAPKRRTFVPWLTEVVRYLGRPAQIEWGLEKDGLALRLTTMRPDYPAGAPVRVAAVFRNASTESLAVVGARWKSELEPWTVSVNGKGLVSRLHLFGGWLARAKESLRELGPGESLALSVPARYDRGVREQSSCLTWGLPPGRHRVELVYRLTPEQIQTIEWTGARIWTGELRSNVMTLVIGEGE